MKIKNKNIKTLIILSHFYFIFLVFSSESKAWQDQPDLNRLITTGDSLLNNKKYQNAKDIYIKVLKYDNNFRAARGGLGRIAIAEQDWGEAISQFGDVIDIDPDNPEAHYYRGIGYRERGKFKALLLRKLDWWKSRKDFEKVIISDSLFEDVFYQFGILKRYQNNFTEAILLGHTQIKLKPELSESELGLFRFYQYFIRNQGQTEVLDWFAAQKWDYADYFAGEKLRREDKLAEAKVIFEDLRFRPVIIPRSPILLSLAKTSYMEKNPEKAENYYWRAVESIRDELGANLIFEDLKYIITDQELEIYRSYKSVPEWQHFFEIFWLSRNPLPAARLNERLAEHYRRYLYAEKWYEYDGFRSWFNNPDKLHYLNYPESYSLNQEFNDKGLIFIRQGEADDWARSSGDSMPSNESWQYYETQFNPLMTFHFLKENTSADNWRLAPYLDDPRMMEDRLNFGTEYFRIMRGDPLEMPSLLNEMAEESKKAVSTALTTDRHTWKKEIEALQMPFTMVTFRGDSGNTRIELYYGISTEQFDTNIADSLWEVVLESGMTIHDLQYNEVDRETKDSYLIKPPQGFRSWIDVFKFTVLPDSYQVAIFGRPHNSNLLGGSKFSTRIENYSTPNLSLSDILLADNITPATENNSFVTNGLQIVPNPARQFPIDKPIFLYFEIYKLNKDARDKTSYSLEYTLKLIKQKKGVIKKLFGLFSGKSQSSISIKSDHEGDSENSVENLGIDVSQLKPGEYQLLVKVVDNSSGQIDEKEVKLFLIK